MSSNEAKKEKLFRKRKRENTEDTPSTHSSSAENEVCSMSRKARQNRLEFELNCGIAEVTERKSRCPGNLTGSEFKFAAWSEIQKEIEVYMDDNELRNKLVYFKKMHCMINLITSRGIQFDKESKRFLGSSQAWDDILMEYQSNDVLNDLRVYGCDFYDSLVRLCSRFPAVKIRSNGQGSSTGSFSSSSSSGKQTRESCSSVKRSVEVHSSDGMQYECLSKEMEEFKAQTNERLLKDFEELKAQMRELKMLVGANTTPPSS